VATQTVNASGLPANATLVFEFPRAPATLARLVRGKPAVAAASVYLPKDYRAEREFPLLLYLDGGYGGDGRDPASARKVVGDRGFICATLPLFKRRLAKLRKDEKNFWPRLLIRDSDSKRVWDAYAPMLERIFATVPNIDRERTILGGFSNGAHTAAVLLNRRQAEIREYFSRFLLVEGGFALRATAALRRTEILILQGSEHRKRWLRPAERAARKAKARVRLLLMKGVGHAFPQAYQRRAGAWAREVCAGSRTER